MLPTILGPISASGKAEPRSVPGRLSNGRLVIDARLRGNVVRVTGTDSPIGVGGYAI